MDKESDSAGKTVGDEEVAGSRSLKFDEAHYEWKQPFAVHKTCADHTITYSDAFEDTVACSSTEDCGEEANEDDRGGWKASDDVMASSDFFSVSDGAQPVDLDRPAEDWDAELDTAYPYGMPTPYVHKGHEQPKGNTFSYSKAISRLFRHLRLKPDAPDVCEGQFDDA